MESALPEENATAEQPGSGSKIVFTCPVCGDGYADAEDMGGYRLIGCHSDSCKAMGGVYLAELAEAYGLPRNASKAEIVGAIRANGGHARKVGPPPPLPTDEQAIRWGVKLRRGCAAREWLRTDKGLSLSVLRDTRVGWDEQRRIIVLPMYFGGSIVAYKTRVLGDGKPLKKPLGSGAWDWPLYPEPQRAFGWTWLVEGEWDALRLRSFRLPAVSVTGGKSHWRDEWADQLQGLYVRVMYDVGAEPQARKAVRRLRRLGVNARHHPARLLGLTVRNADVSDYLAAGGDALSLARR